jgi:Holliday junction resolvase RusA-like endonuclease
MLPKMANGGHGNWKADHFRKKKIMQAVSDQLWGKLPKKPLKSASGAFVRYSSKEPDYDGLVHGFKPVIDALVKLGVLENDTSEILEREYSWVKESPRKGRVEVHIVELGKE